MVYFRIGIMVLFLPWVSACASLAISGLTMGAGYSLMNKADKTTNYSMNKVFGATMLALNKMGIKISDTTRSAKVTKINAATESLGIAIELEKITLKTTKIGVEARKEMFLKDKSTAEEIIRQIQKILDDRGQSLTAPYLDGGQEEYFDLRIEPSAAGNWL